MKRYLPAIAGAILIVAIAVGLFWMAGHEPGSNAHGRPTKSSTGLELDGAHDRSGVGRTHLRRPTLEQNLPPGARLVKSNGKSGAVEVALADGMRLRAAGASVTENGVSFEGPYELIGNNGLSMSSEDDECFIFISRDGKTLKTGGATTTTPPSNEEDAEKVGASDGVELPN